MDNYNKVTWNFFDVVWLIVLALIIFPYFLSTVFGLFNLSYETPIIDLVISLISGCATVYLACKMLKDKGHIVKEVLGIEGTRKNVLNIFNGIALFIACIFVGVMVVGITNYFNLVNLDSKEVYGDISYLALISSVIMAPLLEELLFRGLLQPCLIKSSGVPLGVVVTALIFTLLHFQYSSGIGTLIQLFAGAIMWGMMRHYTKSIIPSTLTHFLNNLWATLYILG